MKITVDGIDETVGMNWVGGSGQSIGGGRGELDQLCPLLRWHGVGRDQGLGKRTVDSSFVFLVLSREMRWNDLGVSWCWSFYSPMPLAPLPSAGGRNLPSTFF